MKWYSPIFLIVFLCLTNCSNNQDLQATAISDVLQKAYGDNASQVRLQAARQAFRLSSEIQNDSLRFKSAVAEYDIISMIYPDSVPHYLKKLEQLSVGTSQKGTFFLRKADALYYKSNYLDAYKAYKEATDAFEQPKDNVKIAYALIGMTQIANIFNDYNGSQETATEALKLLKGLDRKDYERQLYNLLGISFTNLNNYPKAIESYQHVLKISDDRLSESIIRNNTAYVYILDKKYQQAIDRLLPLLNDTSVSEVLSEKARVLHNLGYAYYKQNPQNGLSQLQQALDIRVSINEEQDLSFSYLDLSEFYTFKNPAIAMQYSEKALKAAKKVHSIDQQIDALTQLVKLSDATNSKVFFNEYERLNDSITTVRNLAKNEFAKQRYDFREADNRAAKAEIDALVHQQQKLIYALVSVVVFVVAIAVIYILRKRHKKAKRLEKYKTETRLSKKIHDELANDVFLAMTFADHNDLSLAENKDTLVNNLDDIYSRTRDISKENSKIETGSEFKESFKSMISEYQTMAVSVMISGYDSVDWIRISTDKQIELYRITQELLTNMKKHSQCGRVILTFKKEQKNLVVTYADDGIGLENNGLKKYNGLWNVENRILEMKGTITFENTSGKGFKASFTLPV